MVSKFYCSKSRFLNMGIGILKRLLNEAKSTSDVITIEATVITGFEGQAVDECKQVCKPENVARSKGRIFFNIKKDSYPKVLKMRSIDNVFLVSEAFEELKLTKLKEEDLLIVKNLAEKVNWSKSVPQWAEIVDFKGVQFPKCANRGNDEPLDESEPVCQNCLIAKTEGAGGGVQATNEASDPNTDSPKPNLISEGEVFQTPPNDCAQPDCVKPESRQQEGCGQMKCALSESEEVFQTPPNDCCVKLEACQEEGCKEIDTAVDKNGSALESSPETHLLPVKQTVDTDEDAFHSAEEDPQPEKPARITAAPVAPQSVQIGSDAKEADDKSSGEIASHHSKAVEGGDVREGQHKKKKANWERRKEKRLEAKRNRQSQTEMSDSQKPADCPQEGPDSSSGCDENQPNDAAPQNGPAKSAVDENNQKKELNGVTTDDGTEPAGDAKPQDKKKNYWQKRKEAKAKKAAEAKAKKPPRKVYVNDGIMKFRVTCYRNGPKHSFDSNDAAGHFGGLINDKFHWTVDLTRHDINVVLVIEEDSAYVSLALTKQSLHRRNIKNFGPTTLRATLCYSLIRFAEPLPGDIIMDPMCGGGSISIEGALAFPGTYHICGDVNEKCVEKIADNVAYNSQEKPLLVDGFQWSVRRLPLRDESIDVIVTDLPFGLRVGKQRDNTGLYTAALHEVARVVRPLGRASLLTYDKTAMIRALQKSRHLWREIHCNMVNQGGLRCFAYLLLRRSATNTVSSLPASDHQLVEDTGTGDSENTQQKTSGDRETDPESPDASQDVTDQMSQLLVNVQNPQDVVPEPHEVIAGSPDTERDSPKLPDDTKCA